MVYKQKKFSKKPIALSFIDRCIFTGNVPIKVIWKWYMLNFYITVEWPSWILNHHTPQEAAWISNFNCYFSRDIIQWLFIFLSLVNVLWIIVKKNMLKKSSLNLIDRDFLLTKPLRTFFFKYADFYQHFLWYNYQTRHVRIILSISNNVWCFLWRK